MLQDVKGQANQPVCCESPFGLWLNQWCPFKRHSIITGGTKRNHCVMSVSIVRREHKNSKPIDRILFIRGIPYSVRVTTTSSKCN